MNKEKRQSLLKPYTNFDRIKDMSVDEMAAFLDEVNSCLCMICSKERNECEFNDYYLTPDEQEEDYCHKNITKWLESEAEE